MSESAMEILNKRIFHDYELLEHFEAGVVLLGSEVKSLRLGRAKLDGAFIKIIGNEAFLVGASIVRYSFSAVSGYDPDRTRKLLLHKKQIFRLLMSLKSENLAIVPVKWYTIGHRIKLDIALARGKKQFEKREILKKRALTRDLERDFRGKVKR